MAEVDQDGPRRSGTVAGRLRRAFAVLVATLVMAVGSLAATTLLSKAAVDDLAYRLDPLRTANDRLLQAVVDSETGFRGFLVTGDDAFLEPLVDGRRDFTEMLGRARRLAAGDQVVSAQLDAQERLFGDWLAGFAEPTIALRRGDARSAESAAATGRGKAVIDQVRAANAAAGDHIETLRTEARRRVTTTGRVTAAVALLVLALGTGTAIVQARRVRDLVTRPLERLGVTLGDLRAGHLSARAPVGGLDDVAAVGEAVNALAAESQRLSLQQRRRLERERLLRSLSGAVRQHLDAGAVLDLAAAGLGRSTGADRVVIRAVEGVDAAEVMAQWTAPGIPAADLSASLADEDFAEGVRERLRAQPSLAISDVDEDPLVTPATRAFYAAHHVRSVVLVPAMTTGGTHALITLQSVGRARVWDEDALALAEGLAREVGVALSHADLYDRQALTVDRLQELDQAKTDFVSSVSHELRTPLTSIRGYVEMLRDGDGGPVADQQDRMLGVVERNTDRLLALIEDLLTLSSIEAGSFKVTMAPVAVEQVVVEAVAAVGPDAAARRLDLAVAVAPGLPPVLGDRHQLERVVLNLLANAVKFTPDGGRVEVGAEQAGASVVLRVTDTGIGIPSEEQGKLFTRFFRSSTANERGVPGTGLGLVIVKSIVENHGGTVAVSSASGEGTTLTVTLAPALAPLAEAAPDRTKVPAR